MYTLTMANGQHSMLCGTIVVKMFDHIDEAIEFINRANTGCITEEEQQELTTNYMNAISDEIRKEKNYG